MIEHVYACRCGVETVCEADDLKLGHVFQCPSCMEVAARVRPQRGGSAWITVAPGDVAFYELLPS